MTRRATIGVDVGTTTVKVVVAADDFEVLAEAASSTLSMHSDPTGRSEESPRQIIDCVVEAVNAAVHRTPDDVQPVALAVASQSGSIVGLDASGSPIGQLITWMDSRSATLVETWRGSSLAATIRSISGWNPGTGLGLATLAWIAANQPDRNDVAVWAGADTLVTAFLTGAISTNPSNAAAMQLADVSEGGWSTELCQLAGVEPGALPSLKSSGERLGRVTAEAASRCSLPVGLPVIAGGHDQTCAALALDVVEPGHVLVGSGTAWVVTSVAESRNLDVISSRFNVSPHVVPGRITASEYLGGLGAEYGSWVNRTYGPITGHTTDQLDTFELAEADIEASNSRGKQGLGIMIRSAEQVRDSLAQLTSSGLALSRITLVGGITASSVWPNIIADVTELPVDIPGDNSWPAIGAARLAATGAATSHHPDSHPSPQAQEKTT